MVPKISSPKMNKAAALGALETKSVPLSDLRDLCERRFDLYVLDVCGGNPVLCKSVL